MNRNTRLVPTPIVDKNGKPTVVHRKPPKASSGAVIPGPITEPAGTSRRAVVERVSRIVESIMDSTDVNRGIERGMVRKMMDELHSTEFLLSMEKYLGSTGSESVGVAEQISYGESERPILETLHFHSQLEGANYTRTAAQVESLRFYQIAPSGADLLGGDELVQEQLLAVLKVTDAIERTLTSRVPVGVDADHPLRHIHTSFMGQPVHELRDYALVELVKERSAEADQMSAIISEYKTYDPQVIRGILDGVTPSLAIGSL